MKKLVSAFLCAALAAAMLSGCAAKSSASSSAAKTYKVAIVQLVDNDAFTQMVNAFENKMRSLGYGKDRMSFDVKNAQGDMSTLNSICAKVKDSSYDLIVPIVTPATQAVVNVNPKAPVVFISVTDPVGAGILSDMKKPDKNATGTSNIIPVDKIFTLAKQLTPSVKTVGVLYCSGEKNAVLNAKKAETYLDENGYKYVESTVTNSSEVQQTAQVLAGRVDAIFVPTDSTVQSAMAQLVAVADGKKIPVYGSDPVMVKSGALACVSVSNTQLGERSAEMADSVLKGKQVSEVPAEALTDYQYVVSKKTAQTLGVTLPSDGSVTIMG
jgi:putative tryptophan/tyrosine transport system substrate-binding protein